jgi:hypothetical protein
MLSAMLLCWGWSFHLLSRLCFCLAEAYICLVESLILKPLGYRPILASERVRKHCAALLSSSPLQPKAGLPTFDPRSCSLGSGKRVLTHRCMLATACRTPCSTSKAATSSSRSSRYSLLGLQTSSSCAAAWPVCHSKYRSCSLAQAHHHPSRCGSFCLGTSQIVLQVRSSCSTYAMSMHSCTVQAEQWDAASGKLQHRCQVATCLVPACLRLLQCPALLLCLTVHEASHIMPFCPAGPCAEVVPGPCSST